jgi:hypothetical protein
VCDVPTRAPVASSGSLGRCGARQTTESTAGATIERFRGSNHIDDVLRSRHRSRARLTSVIESVEIGNSRFRCGRLEGRPQARPCRWPSFETRRKDAAFLSMRSAGFQILCERCSVRDGLSQSPHARNVARSRSVVVQRRAAPAYLFGAARAGPSLPPTVSWGHCREGIPERRLINLDCSLFVDDKRCAAPFDAAHHHNPAFDFFARLHASKTSSEPG